ncbi:hypothetical protein CGCVW01_v001038 [Colletotrichum viniferum]|nr:hypothetical protein CGCVW01_v001038 [Colletotrichum viniferum]
MACRKSHSAQHTWGFQTLPCELRHQILEDLRQQAGSEQRLSAWAHVAREWQRFFESDIFESLSLRTPGPDTRQLENVVAIGRQKFVRKISLHVHLARYSKKENYEFEDEGTRKANIKVFSDAILDLFSILSRWKDGASAQGLTFELSACSPSYYLKLGPTSRGFNTRHHINAYWELSLTSSSTPHRHPFPSFQLSRASL